MNLIFRIVGLAVGVALSFSVSADDFVFRDVNVVDVRDGRILSGQDVAVSGRWITYIGEAGRVEVAGTVIEGLGKYLTPGLMDMHTHVSRPDQLIINMAFGVTTVRVMWGNPDTLKLRAQVQENMIPGPRIVAAGMLYDGLPPYWPGSVALTDANLADALVAGQKEAGYDFVKVYSRLTPEVFNAIMAAADKHGIEASGHVPQSVSFRSAVNSGLRTSEHFTGVLAAVMADPGLANPDVSPMFEDTKGLMEKIGRGEVDGSTMIDWRKVEELAKYSAQLDHWFVVTHHIMRNFTDNPLPPFEDGLRFLSAEERMIVLGDVGAFFGLTADQKNGETIMYEHRTKVLKAFHDAGAKIVVGTDQQSMVGLATIAEMQALNEAGISIPDVIRAATIEPARYLEREGDLGEVAVDAEADLLLLDANPLEDLVALRGINGVMTRGIWYDRIILDTMLDGVAERAAATGE